jgi:hypothetical protein
MVMPRDAFSPVDAVSSLQLLFSVRVALGCDAASKHERKLADAYAIDLSPACSSLKMALPFSYFTHGY